MKTNIAILEDNEQREWAMREALSDAAPDARCFFFNTAPKMIEWLATNLRAVSLMSLVYRQP
jgi:hypothetical protein